MGSWAPGPGYAAKPASSQGGGRKAPRIRPVSRLFTNVNPALALAAAMPYTCAGPPAGAGGGPQNITEGNIAMKPGMTATLALAALSAAAGAAHADSREDAMLRLPRCSAIADQRQYLDCFYAAAQPMRGQLGLAAAPQAAGYEAIFSGQAPAPQGAPGPAVLATRETVMLRLTHCAAIGDTRQYLDCYYAAAQPMRAELGLAAAPQASTYEPLFSLSQAVPASARPAMPPTVPMADNRPNLVPQSAYSTETLAVRASTARQARLAGDEGATSLPIIGGLIGIRTTRVPVEQFGLRDARPSPAGVDHIAAHIVNVVFDKKSGDFTVTLDNGQVWRQVPEDDQRARWQKGRMDGKVATVAYGAGDTFNFSVGEHIAYKVRRVS